MSCREIRSRTSGSRRKVVFGLTTSTCLEELDDRTLAGEPRAMRIRVGNQRVTRGQAVWTFRGGTAGTIDHRRS